MSYGFTPGTASQPTSNIELTISCRNLIRHDLLSKSDPMVVMYTQPFAEKRWIETYRSEPIMNDHNPDFTKKVHISYRFEEQQCLKFEVYDVDCDSTYLEDHDFIGAAFCTLAQIVSSGKVQMPIKKRLGGEAGVLLVTAEELSSSRDEVSMQFSGHKLDKKSFFWKSSPCLVIQKSTESGDYIVVHKTEVSQCTLNPDWRRFSIPVRELCNNDYDRNLKFICYHGNPSDGSIIGMFHATLKQLSTGPGIQNSFQCVNPEKQKKKGSSYTDSGKISLTHFEIRKVHTFVEYLKGGTQIHCSVAIDFTASNGNPSDPLSLHYTGNPTSTNPYEMAISSVVGILEDYDSDKMLPTLGFGARLPPDGRVSHEFFVNLHPTDPYCKGVTGVLQAYRNCLTQIQLHGPTNFAPVINHVARFARSYKDGDSYFILLILTDGEITDMPQTTQAIVEASTLPMSIIIVGVGDSNFANMEKLDGDTVALQSGGKRAARDIVQFVPFNKFLQGDITTARLRLAQEVLAEVPTQFLGYMKAKNIIPKPSQTNVQVVLPSLIEVEGAY